GSSVRCGVGRSTPLSAGPTSSTASAVTSAHGIAASQAAVAPSTAPDPCALGADVLAREDATTGAPRPAVAMAPNYQKQVCRSSFRARREERIGAARLLASARA